MFCLKNSTPLHHHTMSRGVYLRQVQNCIVSGVNLVWTSAFKLHCAAPGYRSGNGGAEAGRARAAPAAWRWPPGRRTPRRNTAAACCVRQRQGRPRLAARLI